MNEHVYRTTVLKSVFHMARVSTRIKFSGGTLSDTLQNDTGVVRLYADFTGTNMVMGSPLNTEPEEYDDILAVDTDELASMSTSQSSRPRRFMPITS